MTMVWFGILGGSSYREWLPLGIAGEQSEAECCPESSLTTKELQPFLS